MRGPGARSRTVIGLAAAAVVGFGCGDSTGGGAGSDLDGRDAADADRADAGPADRELPPADGGPIDASDTRDGGDAGDAGRFTPGNPPWGDEELAIFASKDAANVRAQAPVRQGDLVYWECGTQAPGIGHVLGSFRLVSDALGAFSEARRAAFEDRVRLQLIEPTDQGDVVIAENEGLVFKLDFETAGELASDGPIPVVINRDVVGAGTNPSDIDGELFLYRVTVPVPDGPTFTREVWVDTLVADPDGGC